MKCACSLTPVLALVGLVGLGVGGYNLMSTGCPLGGDCHEEAPAAATLVNASEVKTMDCCAGMEKVAGCDSEKTEANVKTVANVEKTAENCTAECSTKVCEDKLAKDECPHAAKTAEGKQTCPMHPEAGAVAVKDKK
jgi:xanthosine utilization system XapX-like protein